MGYRLKKLVDERQVKVAKQIDTVVPGQPFKGLLPDVSGFSDQFNLTEAWSWAEPRKPVAVESMATGKRVIVHSLDGKVEAFDGKGDKADGDFSFLQLDPPQNFVIDAYIDEDSVSLMEILFFNGESLAEKPYTERRKALDAYFNSVTKSEGRPSIEKVSTATASTLEELAKETEKLFALEPPKGVVLKALDSTYPLDGRTTNWLATFPPEEDEQVVAKSMDPTQVAALKLMGYKFITKERKKPDWQADAKVLKVAKDKRLITTVVLRPNRFDAGDDIMTQEEVQWSAHHFMSVGGVIGVRHKRLAPAIPVESFIAPVDFVIEDGDRREQVLAGDWVLVIFVEDEDFWVNRVLTGEFNGVSVGGFGLKREIS